jgi:hypothetical protein
MPLTHFTPGTLAKAEELNDNFDYLLQLIGVTSDPEGARPKRIYLGDNSTFVLAAENASNGPIISNYCKLTYANSAWSYTRIATGKAPSAIEFGSGRVLIRVAEDTSGSLTESQFKVAFGVVNDTDENFIYVPSHFNTKNTLYGDNTIEEYRLSTVFLQTPVTIFSGKSFGTGSTSYKPSSLSTAIPFHAKGVILYASFKASSEARWWVYPKGTDRQYGGSWSTHGDYRNSGNQQMCYLKSGQFTLEREGNSSSASLYIQGYLI